MPFLDPARERGREILARQERKTAFLEELRRIIREEVGSASPACACGLDETERKSIKRLLLMSQEVGIENMRDHHQFVEELRKGADQVKQTALTVSVGAAVTAVGAGLFLLFKTKVGN